ncbi:Stage II sporulation protein E (SpoIIE) [Tenacibaculum sp. 190524A02b]|uniref:Stage II sporulation protein E (SpoIIE) n=1 Tax=Tenacibaculum vairaonense TaxID=3137860 RepID=A0ABP1FC17_9FLAO
MKIHTTLQIGEFHTKYCEDFLVVENIATNQKLIAVMDGCTMGKESVFAAMLYGKILRNIAKKTFYKDFVTKETTDLKSKLKDIIQELIVAINATKKQLDLDTYELLSTLIISVVDTKETNAEILVVGDGLVCVDEVFYEFEQEDKPDYLGYHLHEDFELWYQKQEQKISITSFKDFSICTDGIFSFKNLKEKNEQKKETKIIQFLLVDKKFINEENCLDRKILYLKQQWNHMPTDDLAIVRFTK